MKLLIALSFLASLFTIRLQAQPTIVEKTMAVPANKKVDLDIPFGNNIKVTAWDRKDAVIKMTYSVNGGRLNDALLLDFKAENGVARIKVDFDREKLKAGRAEDCPDNQRNGSRYYQDGVQIYTCHQIEYEVMLPRDAHLTLESIHCNMELRNLTGPVRAKSIHGFVDMNWPAKKGAELSLKTIHGDVYSDLAITFPGKKGDQRLNGSVNGGGTDINLETVHNNVYLRQSEP